MIYTYYGYLDKFHVVPESWRDLFEYLEYTKTEGKLRKKAEDFARENNK